MLLGASVGGRQQRTELSGLKAESGRKPGCYNSSAKTTEELEVKSNSYKCSCGMKCQKIPQTKTQQPLLGRIPISWYSYESCKQVQGVSCAPLGPLGTDGDLWVWCLDQGLNSCFRSGLEENHLCLRLLVKDMRDKWPHSCIPQVASIPTSEPVSSHRTQVSSNLHLAS